MHLRQGLIAAGLLLACLVLFETTSLDLVVQDLLFDADTGSWLVDRDSPLPRFLLYDGPKAVLGGWLVCVALSLVRPGWCPTLSPFDRRRAFYVLACVALIPGTVALLKASTNVYYPYKVERYGGRLPYRKAIHSLRQRPGEPRSRGWPAGHASGGFALLCLAFAARTRRGRRLGAAAGLTAGWVTGFYQMAKGAHYLSHTVVTLLLAWLLAALLAWAFRLPDVTSPTADRAPPGGSPPDR